MTTMTLRRAEWTLMTSALMLATALLVMLFAPMTPDAQGGDSTVPAPNGIGVITVANGSGPGARPSESVYVLDNRTEMLMIYTVESSGASRSVALRYVETLPALFRAGRR